MAYGQSALSSYPLRSYNFASTADELLRLILFAYIPLQPVMYPYSIHWWHLIQL